MVFAGVILLFLVILFLVWPAGTSNSGCHTRIGFGLGSNPYILPPPAEAGDTEPPELDVRDEKNIDEPRPSNPSHTMTKSNGAHQGIRKSVRFFTGSVVLSWGSSQLFVVARAYIAEMARGGTYDPSAGFFQVLFETIFGIIWLVIVAVVTFVLWIPSAIWTAIFPDPKAAIFFALGSAVFWLLVESITRLDFIRPAPAHTSVKATPPPVNPKIRTGAGAGQMFFYRFIGLFVPTRKGPRTTPTTAVSKTMSDIPGDNFYEQASQFRRSHPELGLSEVPFPVSEHRTWLESFQRKVQMARTGRETAVAIRVLETILVYLRKLVEREDLYRQGEATSFERDKIRVEKELLQKEKELRVAKLDADTQEQVARKARYEAEARGFKTPPKSPEPSPLDQKKIDLEVAKLQAEIEKITNPKEKEKFDIADQLTRKLDAVHKLEARMNELVEQAQSEDAKARIRVVFREAIGRVMEGQKP